MQNISVGILTLNIGEVMNRISNLLELRMKDIYESTRRMDLLIINKAGNIFKIWVFDQ